MDKQKTFNIRLPVNLWRFLKQFAIEHETTMNAVIVDKIERMKKTQEKKLTDGDAMVL